MTNNYTSKDHTFVICAYKESEYLPACIESLLNQKVKSNIIISTSTPNKFISDTAKKYDIELRINNNPPSIASDWNYAYKQANTRLITLAHQDDIYLPDYLSNALDMINTAKDPIIFFSHYAIIKDETLIIKNKRLTVRKMLLSPVKLFPGSRFFRRRALSLGNVICCPSVTYINIKDINFSGELTFCLDWHKWEELSKQKGSFVYTSKALVHHRLHSGGETSNAMRQGIRYNEDYEMFRMFWPASAAKIITKLYTR